MSDQAAPSTASAGAKEGWIGALLSPLFLGFAPILGKIAFVNGADPFTVAAVRTAVATGILWIIYLLFWRRFIYIYPAGLVGCAIIGIVNGVGSLFYYNGLSYLDASLAQLLNATYLIFVVVLTRYKDQTIRLQLVSGVFLSLVAVILIIAGANGQVSWLGASLMMGNAVMFAGTVILSQRVLYEMPAPTMALYVLTTMAIVVILARVVAPGTKPLTTEALWAMIALGGTTALARLALFMGVKILGSLQTALLSIFELAVTLILAFIVLQERMTPIQWIGAAILVVSLIVIKPRTVPVEAKG